jgi:anaerobic selenocysteine-containing dehydrogenase
MTFETPTARTVFRTCPLCEAGCGLEIAVRDGMVERIRGDRDDVFSRGFLCPKGTALKQLRSDPDRLRKPLVKCDGQFMEVSWSEAWSEVDQRFRAFIAAHGRRSLAVYAGNPTAHSLGASLYLRHAVRALRTDNIFSAGTLDQRPKEISAAMMFGGGLTIPVPDIDRTDFMIMLGANPMESNGSLASAPDWPGRIERLIDRGGSLVVIDPCRTRTALAATEHIAIRPGTDALLLMSMVNVFVTDGLVKLGRLATFVDGLEEVSTAARPFTPEAVGPGIGIDARLIRRLAHQLAAAPRGVVYGRMGTTAQEFGTLASWLVDVLNVVSGNLDAPGGAMWPPPPGCLT